MSRSATGSIRGAWQMGLTSAVMLAALAVGGALAQTQPGLCSTAQHVTSYEATTPPGSYWQQTEWYQWELVRELVKPCVDSDCNCPGVDPTATARFEDKTNVTRSRTTKGTGNSTGWVKLLWEETTVEGNGEEGADAKDYSLSVHTCGTWAAYYLKRKATEVIECQMEKVVHPPGNANFTWEPDVKTELTMRDVAFVKKENVSLGLHYNPCTGIMSGQAICEPHDPEPVTPPAQTAGP